MSRASSGVPKGQGSDGRKAGGRRSSESGRLWRRVAGFLKGGERRSSEGMEAEPAPSRERGKVSTAGRGAPGTNREGENEMRWRRTKSQAELSLDGFNKLRKEGRVGPPLAPAGADGTEMEREAAEVRPIPRKDVLPPVEIPVAVPKPRTEPVQEAAEEESREAAPVAVAEEEPRPEKRRRRAPRAHLDMPPHLRHHQDTSIVRKRLASREERLQAAAAFRAAQTARPSHLPHFDPSQREITSIPEVDAHQHLHRFAEHLRVEKVELRLPDIDESGPVELRLPDIENTGLPAVDPVDPLTGEVAPALLAMELKVPSPLLSKTLRDNGLLTFGDILEHTEESLLALKGVGRKSLELLKEKLARHGLSLRGQDDAAGPKDDDPSLFDAPPRSEIDLAEEMIDRGDIEGALARLLRGVEARLLSVASHQGMKRGVFSPIRAVRKLLLDRQISRITSEHLLETIRIASRAVAGHEVAEEQAREAFRHARSGLQKLNAELSGLPQA